MTELHKQIGVHFLARAGGGRGWIVDGLGHCFATNEQPLASYGRGMTTEIHGAVGGNAKVVGMA